MAKDPAFLFYPDDFSGGTKGMTIEEKGAYMELLIFQFNNKGRFTLREAQRVLGMDVFNRVWEYLVCKFIDDNGNYFNERLRVEIEKRAAYKKLQSEKGKASAAAAAAKKLQKSTTVEENNNNGCNSVATQGQHLGNGNGNISSSILNSELVKEIARKVFSDRIWADATGMGHSITRDELAKWMAQFNASLVGDNIDDFNDRKYKKMFGGWLNKQRSKGYKLPDKQASITAPLQKLN